MIDLSVLTLYPTALLNSYICLRRFIVDSLGFSMQTVMSSINREIFCLSFQAVCVLVFVLASLS